MKILKIVSTKCRRVFHGRTITVLFDPLDPSFMDWYTIEIKLFGLFWVTIHKYEAIFYLYKI